MLASTMLYVKAGIRFGSASAAFLRADTVFECALNEAV
jgi:hypothetical protein